MRWLLDRLGRRSAERDFQWVIGAHVTVYYPRRWRGQRFVYWYRSASRYGYTWVVKVYVGPVAWIWDRERFPEEVR